MSDTAKRVLGLILLAFAFVNALAIYALFSVFLVPSGPEVGAIGLNPVGVSSGYHVGLILAFVINVFLLGFFGISGFRYLTGETPTERSGGTSTDE